MNKSACEINKSGFEILQEKSHHVPLGQCFPNLYRWRAKKHAVIPWRANPLVVENLTTGGGGSGENFLALEIFHNQAII